MAEDAAKPQTPAPATPASAPPSAEKIADAALASAEAAVASLANDAEGATAAAGGPQRMDLPNFGTGSSDAAMPQGMDLLADVNLNVKIELGRTRMLVEDVLKLNAGSVVELDKLAGDPVDIYVNDRPVARGEVLVLNDNFCVRINEILSSTAERGAVATATPAPSTPASAVPSGSTPQSE